MIRDGLLSLYFINPIHFANKDYQTIHMHTHTNALKKNYSKLPIVSTLPVMSVATQLVALTSLGM